MNEVYSELHNIHTHIIYIYSQNNCKSYCVFIEYSSKLRDRVNLTVILSLLSVKYKSSVHVSNKDYTGHHAACIKEK